jgi:hypothetical protein
MINKTADPPCGPLGVSAVACEQRRQGESVPPVCLSAVVVAGAVSPGYREGIEVAPYFAKRTQMWLGRLSRPLPMSTDQSVKAHLPARRGRLANNRRSAGAT